MKILDGKNLKNILLADLKNKVENLNLSLAVIQIGNDDSSTVYINQKRKLCDSLQVKFNHITLDNNVSESEVLNIIDNLNNDDTTGILLQLPIPNHLNEAKLQNAIHYKKDVDGLNYININKIINREKGLIPCTAKGIIKILKHYEIDLESKNVVIVGRSNLVGKPVSNLFLNENSTVTICHSKTKDLYNFTKKADILVVATGVKHLINKKNVKNNSIVIDVGINRVNNKLYGDVDFESVKEIVKYITPVPGGIGPMTICMLAENLYDAYLLQRNVE